ncbi:MAG: DNA-binding protein YbiB [Brachymonas denitrificans]|jgi:anthranilate phosphoribosyltransferase|uniref:DNA-binding protein YbiB n=1 Tax=Brachymonas denitrificans TaxID=28220 RepID=UPI001BCEFC62|nr:DNA-binding protein YbiB [Brachymonas denitrificans]
MHETLIPYLKGVGRGKEGARPLTREEASDAWQLLLQGQPDEMAMGAFLLAMRIKGETREEMAGFLDATHCDLHLPELADDSRFAVVIPSYNGARKLPLLTPMLAWLLAREGLRVLMHGHPTEDGRVTVPEVLQALRPLLPVQDSDPLWLDTAALSPGLARVLDARRRIGLRNSAHSLVKLMNPLHGTPLQQRSLVIGAYTHPEYAVSMAEVIGLMQGNALLLRGTEGEVVADARRVRQMDGYVRGEPVRLVEAQTGSLTELPGIPEGTDAAATARYSADVLAGALPVPEPIARQVQAVLDLVAKVES